MIGLRKKQKSLITAELEDKGFFITDFSFETEGIDVNTFCVTIKYLPEDYFFALNYNHNAPYPWECRFSPGIEHLNESTAFTEFKYTSRAYLPWLDQLKEEIEAPDPWAELEKYRSDFTLKSPGDIVNEPISYSETVLIIESLHSLEEKINDQFELSSEQRGFIANRIGYLEKTVKRVHRFDWINIALGVLNMIPYVLKLDPSQVTQFFTIVQETFGSTPYFLPS